ncbi:MAG TPA: alpha/beta family hydrolase [Dissulfurispiraceae bacterium]|nr:alpha/beta family hydrolase [Dissulfurispiraceae bacterium]
MHSIESLKIAGRSTENLPNTFFRSKAETSHLAVLLPGLGYTSQMPVMYYPCLTLLATGADVMRADYNYVRQPDFMALEPDERRRSAAEDALAIFRAAIGQRRYNRITLVGKSIGTYAMGHIITTVANLPHLSCIWLTPLLKHEQLLSQIKHVRHRALIVTGTADPYYDKANLDELLKTTGGESVVIDGADHSMEIDGDPIKSLQALERIMRGIVKFVG